MFGWCLSLIGFGVKGVIKGSLAAAIQSSYGLIKAGSWFAKLTSIAMAVAWGWMGLLQFSITQTMTGPTQK